MKDREKEQIEEMYNHYGYRCFVSGKPATQRAHIIGNTLANKSKYGKAVIDSPFNWLPAHGLRENSLIDIGCNSDMSDFLAFNIEHKNRFRIEELVRDNIQRKLNK